MPLDRSIPGFAEIDEWPITPTPPMSIAQFDRYRDGGPMGGTVFVIIADSAQQRYQIFFDSFLGRLCFGATHHQDDGAAFVKVGSSMESQIIEMLDHCIAADERFAELRASVQRAKHWSPNYGAA